jgi:hypothetical protein
MKRGKGTKKKTVAPKKKKVSKSKKSSKKISSKNKKLLAISIAAFLILAIALAFVNVPQNSSVTGKGVDSIGGEASSGGETSSDSRIKDMFSGGGDLDINIAKYLIFFMLLILITSVLGFAKFPENGFLRFLLALPIAFLSSAYLIPAEILTILQSYEALGIVLSFILPFVILLFFSAMLASNEKIASMSMPKVMLEVFLWLFFAIVLGYKIIIGLINGEIPLGLNLPLLIMGAVFLVSLLIFVFNKKFRNWMWKITIDIRRAKNVAMRVEAIERQKTQKALTDLEDKD